jgi:hypothetical protein
MMSNKQVKLHNRADQVFKAIMATSTEERGLLLHKVALKLGHQGQFHTGQLIEFAAVRYGYTSNAGDRE